MFDIGPVYSGERFRASGPSCYIVYLDLLIPLVSGISARLCSLLFHLFVYLKINMLPTVTILPLIYSRDRNIDMLFTVRILSLIYSRNLYIYVLSTVRILSLVYSRDLYIDLLPTVRILSVIYSRDL